jgi:hypothetical protein
MIDKSEWLKNSKWLISTLWKNSKSLAQGGHAQAHAYTFFHLQNVLSWYTSLEALESLKINYWRTLEVQAQVD